MNNAHPQSKLRSRYEFRVWGDQDEAYERLLNLADSAREEQLEDCYLLMADPACNLKIRRNRLKVKRLVEERFGFQRWSTNWHRVAANAQAAEQASQATPDPTLAHNEAGLANVVNQLHPAVNLRPVFVTKYRQRFRFGSMRAEVTDMEIGGQSGRMCTTAIEGRNLLDLIQLRSSLGFDLVPNVAVHLALDPRFQAD